MRCVSTSSESSDENSVTSPLVASVIPFLLWGVIWSQVRAMITGTPYVQCPLSFLPSRVDTRDRRRSHISTCRESQLYYTFMMLSVGRESFHGIYVLSRMKPNSNSMYGLSGNDSCVFPRLSTINVTWYVHVNLGTHMSRFTRWNTVLNSTLNIS